VTEAARILRVSRPTLSSLLNAKSDLSGEMALHFEKAFGVDMETLMRMQNSYNRMARALPSISGEKRRTNSAKTFYAACGDSYSDGDARKRELVIPVRGEQPRAVLLHRL
jgi:addiction module HigA family antidote